MHIKDKKDIERFQVVGVNYKKTDASNRGLFAINHEQYEHLLKRAPASGLSELFLLSTCNRTEIYGFAPDPTTLMHLLCSECKGSFEMLSEIAYVKKGWDAVMHLFHVGAGLDSQILGDYEILGQIKCAAKCAKANGFLGAFTERLVNSVLQASKAVKTNTQLSSGTVSVAFAAVQYIKEHVSDIQQKKIALLGTGKIGGNTCKNLVDYLGATDITLLNRTGEKAVALADSLGLKHASISALNSVVAESDIILVATNSPMPIVLKKDLENKGKKLIIDMSVPCNVSEEAKALPNVTFIDVDGLSKIKDETLQNRQSEVPKAIVIIDEHISDFQEWYDMRKYVPMLKEVKGKLIAMNTGAMQVTSIVQEEKIQKVINTLAIKMRRNNTVGCHYIEAINEFMAC